MSRIEIIADLERFAAALEALDRGELVESEKLDGVSVSSHRAAEQLRADGIEIQKLQRRVRELEQRAPRRRGTRVVTAQRAAVIEDLKKLERKLRRRRTHGTKAEERE